jgi:hypothetical protein
MQMSNLDFISRSELLAEIDQERKRHIDSGNYGAEHLMVHSLRRLVEEAPAVDAAPVANGRWIEAKGAIRCSECMNTPLYDYFGKIKLSDACPHCGANMEVEHEAD